MGLGCADEASNQAGNKGSNEDETVLGRDWTVPGEIFLGIGAGDQVRTGDINLGKVALYQLSYSLHHWPASLFSRALRRQCQMNEWLRESR